MLKKYSRFFLFRSYKGRHILSLIGSRIVDKLPIKKIAGLNLVAALFITSTISPEINFWLSRFMLIRQVNDTPISVSTQTETTFEKPLANFQISQQFSFWHPGLDMTSAEGTPVYAIEDGVVDYADKTFFGYGKHVIISHPHHIKSLYAHLSEIGVTEGKHISRGELVGRVGSTGWSTGNHLHMEIYQSNTALNPLEVLPIDITKVKFENSVFTASPSAYPQLTYSPN